MLTGIQAFSAWKLSVATEIKRYRMWLHQQGLSTVDLDDKLARCLRAFTTDRILLAFVGEFSRGKTELINALLGRHFKSRLFPTRIGRTTMCPTEVFYDPQSATPYIKLLPIQTRNSGTPLSSYRRQLEHWAHLDIDLNSPQSMQRAFEEVAKTREVPTQVAESLGFEVEFLESSSKKEGYVHIPSWRHALINLDHPLLRLGLSIIDTPGLNALGLEPELTLSFLPDAHALLFVLSAECGVTASDFAIWNNHVRDLAARSNTSLYAIINKIDLLEEEDVDYLPINAEESLRRMVRLSAGTAPAGPPCHAAQRQAGHARAYPQRPGAAGKKSDRRAGVGPGQFGDHRARAFAAQHHAQGSHRDGGHQPAFDEQPASVAEG